jgi:hypothetical protein
MVIGHDSDGASRVAAAFRPLAEAAGVEVPEAAKRLAHTLYVGRERSRPVPQKLIPRVIEQLHGRDLLFRMGGEVVSWCESERCFQPMKARAFVTWLPSSNGGQVFLHAGETQQKDADGSPTGKSVLIDGDLSVSQAELILASEDFRRSLPEVERVAPVCLPIFDESAKNERGEPVIRLARKGYDASVKTFTLGEVSYDEGMDVRDAVMWVHDLVQHFAWRHKERDFSIWLAGLVTMFCRGLFGGRAPAIMVNANIQESGKTLLTWLISWAVHGNRAVKTLEEDKEDELAKYLDTVCRTHAPYVNFDNIDWGGKPIKTALLDTFIQEDEHELRKMGNNTEIGRYVNRTMVLGSGNNITLSRDLGRRSLLVDLWNPMAGSERRLPKEARLIDDEFFQDVNNRKMMLAACWAMVREWDKGGRVQKPGRLLGSFESWARVVPSVVWSTGKLFKENWDCMLASGNDEIGDKQSRDFARLAQLAVKEYAVAPGDAEGTVRLRFEVLVKEFAGLARRHGLESVTGYLWPETSIEAVLACKDFKPPVKKVDTTPAADVEDWMNETEVRECKVDAETLKAASEFLGTKGAASFGKALKTQMHERHFFAEDGSTWSFMNVAGANPRRMAVERVREAEKA